MIAYLPLDFEEYTRHLFGRALYEQFKLSLDDEPIVSVRLNPFKKGKMVIGEPVPWCNDAYWLPSRDEFTLDPLFHAGCYYVQEAGSMFLDRVLRHYVKSPITMLDLCAAPGGKATLARATLPKGSLLYCNEPDRHRVNILVENIQKLGHTDVVVTCNYALDYQKAGITFDLILADVPCSGEGMFRKDEGAIRGWSIKNVIKCAELQRNIISDIWKCLRQGGILVYSTCTFNTRENEENIRWIAENLGAEILSVETKQEWGIRGSMLTDFPEPVYRFIPGVTRSEGLFMAILRKTDSKTITTQKHTSSLRIIYDGQHVRDFQKKIKTAPLHAEALFFDTKKNKYPRTELSKKDALKYLRHESISLDKDVPRSYVIVCYEGHALGFVKNIGIRANNLYPREWRIRNK